MGSTVWLGLSGFKSRLCPLNSCANLFSLVAQYLYPCNCDHNTISCIGVLWEYDEIVHKAPKIAPKHSKNVAIILFKWFQFPDPPPQDLHKNRAVQVLLFYITFTDSSALQSNKLLKSLLKLQTFYVITRKTAWRSQNVKVMLFIIFT